MGHTRTTTGLVVAVALAVVVVAAACSSGPGDAAVTSFTEQDADRVAAAGDTVGIPTTIAPADEATRDDLADGGGGATGADGVARVVAGSATAPAGRDVVYTAEVEVAVDDVAAATRSAVDAVTALGGFVFGQQIAGGADPTATVTFKLAPDAFDEALDRLAGLGDLLHQSVSADDVTERVVDLESRIATTETSVERLRSLLAEAAAIDDIAVLESELLKRETELEQLRGQLRTLQDRVALATITVTILRRASVAPAAGLDLVASLDEDRARPCPGRGALSVGPDDTVVLCFEVVNTGDADLVDITLDASRLRLRAGDLEVLDGPGLERLAPGDTLVVAHRVTLDDGRFALLDARGGIEIALRVSATPVDPAGQRFAEVASGDTVVLDVAEAADRPGFTDGLAGGWTALGWAASLALLVFGFLAPWSPLVAVLAGVVVWRRRRHTPYAPPEAGEPPVPAGDPPGA